MGRTDPKVNTSTITKLTHCGEDMIDLLLTTSMLILFVLLGYQLYILYVRFKSIKKSQAVLKFIKKRGKQTDTLKEFGELLVKLRLAKDTIINTAVLNRLVKNHDEIENFKTKQEH